MKDAATLVQMMKHAATYLHEAEQCLEKAARGDEFQIAAAKYKVEEARALLEAPST